MPGQDVHVLLVDDDEIDAETLIRSFRTLNIANEISIAHDGVEALQRLRGEGGYARLPRPYIILLDISMPRMNGIEFLHALRQDRDLRQSVVFVLTTSDQEQDRLAAYDEHIAGYFVKRDIGEHFLELPKLMDVYWRLVTLPSDGGDIRLHLLAPDN